MLRSSLFFFSEHRCRSVAQNLDTVSGNVRSELRSSLVYLGCAISSRIYSSLVSLQLYWNAQLLGVAVKEQNSKVRECKRSLQQIMQVRQIRRCLHQPPQYMQTQSYTTAPPYVCPPPASLHKRLRPHQGMQHTHPPTHSPSASNRSIDL